MATTRKQKPVESVPITQLYALDSEHVVIAVMFIVPEYFPKIRKIFPDVEVFHDAMNQEIYKAMGVLYDQGVPFDLAALCAVNPQMMRIVDVGDRVSNPPDPNFTGTFLQWEVVEFHLKIIRDAFIRRKLVARSYEKDSAPEIVQIMHDWERMGKENKLYGPKDLSELLLHIMDEPSEGLIRYPWRTFNNIFGGMSPGSLTLACARPGGGKSVFTENAASHAATIQGKNVLFASCEMTTNDIIRRIATRKTGVKLFNRTEPFREDEAIDIYKASQEVKDSRLFIYEVESISDLEAILRDKEHSFDFVVVDYLQRIKPRQKHNSLYERATYASNELAELARRYNLPFLAACQFNRNAEKNQPTLGDLRDSGAIEQDAFTIFSLWTDSEDKSTKDFHPLYVDVLKNRNGILAGNYGDSKFFLQWNRPIFKLQDPK